MWSVWGGSDQIKASKVKAMYPERSYLRSCAYFDYYIFFYLVVFYFLFKHSCYLCLNRMIKTQQKIRDGGSWRWEEKKKKTEMRRETSVWVRGVGKEACIGVGVGDIVKVGGLRRTKAKKDKKRQTPHCSFVPTSQRCSLPCGGLEDTDLPPKTCLPSPHTPVHNHPHTPPSAIVPIPVSPDLLHSPLHMDKWLGPGPAK